MSTLTAEEKSLICLALEEYAAGFSTTLTGAELEEIKLLAGRLRQSRIEAEMTG